MTHHAERAVRHGILSRVLPVERILFTSPIVCLGEFRCGMADPDFAGGVCSGHTMVFPREALWIQHAGGPRFVADPTLITFYNKGQEYARFPISRTDRCDWFAFADDVLRDVAGHVTASASDDRPFQVACGPSHPDLYLLQRRLFTRQCAAAAPTVLEVEECALNILHAALRRAQGSGTSIGRSELRDIDERVQHVRSQLADRLGDPPSLVELAASVDLSPHHLCRSFRAITGTTLRGHRTCLRVLHSLEAVADGDDLTTVAHDLGFSSHSHFTYAFRRTFSAPPSVVRADLTRYARAHTDGDARRRQATRARK
jgi:AraC family transcriptional regulator